MCFLSWNEALLKFGGHKQYLGVGTGPKMHASGMGPVTLFWCTILAWGHTSRLRGTRSDLVGHGPKMPPLVPGLE